MELSAEQSKDLEITFLVAMAQMFAREKQMDVKETENFVEIIKRGCVSNPSLLNNSY